MDGQPARNSPVGPKSLNRRAQSNTGVDPIGNAERGTITRNRANQTPCATDPKILKNQKKIDEKMLRISDMGPLLHQVVVPTANAPYCRHFAINCISIECDARFPIRSEDEPYCRAFEIMVGFLMS